MKSCYLKSCFTFVEHDFFLRKNVFKTNLEVSE